ncbi:hypothetical protein A1O3_00362 [Capronia epimyces CBS 606.96]|uniref:Uncharacterized protein n=1 Tax=Capronia epimyces CBS 606.96 TaxID=1182542 RepID=W9YG00_9EURO|nr:uncharacterized protein A1O3_00362 [Capronia epimyces CBS 606.96]EXJ91812.1 hypothetical protein A1O3_00362 [Capronia epimyces CBS 606.96]
MMLNHPGFLGLKKLTIRREVVRPVDLDLFRLQMVTANQGKPLDIRRIYNKQEMVVEAAAKLAWRAAHRDSIFEGLVYVQQGEEEVRSGMRIFLSNTIEVCLIRGGKTGVATAAENDLHSALLDMLFHGKEADMSGADRAYRRYLRKRGYY